MTHDDFYPLLSRAHAHATEFLRGMPERFVGARAGREEMLAALDAPLPRAGEEPAAVIDLLAAQAERGSPASPRCCRSIASDVVAIERVKPGAPAPCRCRRSCGIE